MCSGWASSGVDLPGWRTDFASPQVVPDVEIRNAQVTQLNVDLDVDYSTYYRDSGQWTDWGPWDWYQTFTAQGTSVRGAFPG